MGHIYHTLFLKYYTATVLSFLTLNSIYLKVESSSERDALKKERNFTFDKSYVGVAFSPYIKNYINGQLPPENNYSLSDVKFMLRVISTRFTNVSTYGMGVEYYNVNNTWDQTNANCLVAKAASVLNAENNKLLITMSQGIHQKESTELFLKEIDNAFEAIAYANTKFRGTVWGVTYANQAISDVADFELLDLVKIGRGRAHALGIKIGARVLNCPDLLEARGRNKRILEEFAKILDYIMCNSHPNADAVARGPARAAYKTGENYRSFIKGFKSVNPNIDVFIGETGWPTKGKSYNGPAEVNTIENMYEYWKTIGYWAKGNKLQVQLFQAIDEPWKSRYQVPDPNQPNGRFGAEGHFGWWKLINNNDIHSIVEKIYEPEETFDTNTPSSSIGLLLGVIIPIGIVIVIVIGYLWYRLVKAKQIIDRLTEQDIKDFEEGCLLPESMDNGDVEINASNMPYNRDFEIPKNKIYIEKEIVLGEGQFGKVFKGMLEFQGTFEEVALKTTKSTITSTSLKSLLSELKLMIYIGSHPNVIKLKGAYTEQIREGVVYIAAEFCGRGSLEKMLRNSVVVDAYGEVKGLYENIVITASENKFKLALGLLKTWCLQIAKGMDYLESKKVIHSDLATRNILVADDYSLRITDFGLSRRLYEYTSYVKQSQEPLPWRWMAYESLKSLQFSSQSDVWSFGVTVWEIFSLGDLPYPGLNYDINFVQELEKGLRMPCPKYATQDIYEKLMNCWNQDPMKRPMFSDLVEFFSSELDLHS